MKNTLNISEEKLRTYGLTQNLIDDISVLSIKNNQRYLMIRESIIFRSSICKKQRTKAGRFLDGLVQELVNDTGWLASKGLTK